MTSFLEQYEKREGAYSNVAPVAPKEPEKKPGILSRVVSTVKNALTPGPAPAPVTPTIAPAATTTPKSKGASFIEQYETRAGLFHGADTAGKIETSPEETKIAGMSSFIGRAPEEVRSLGEQAFKITTSTPALPKPLITPDLQGDLDNPVMAKQYTEAVRSQQPKSLVKKLADGYKAYSDWLGRFSENVAIGEVATVQSFLGAIEWLAPEKDDGSPGNIKRGAGDVADRIGTWLEKVNEVQQDKYGDQTFTDKLAQGVGSSAIFFVPGLGVARGATALATVSPRIAMMFGGSASAALEAMSEAGNVYRSVIAEKNAFMERNSDVHFDPDSIDQDASEAATKTFWANAILIALTNRFGVFNPDTAGFVRRMVMSSPIEGVQEAAQQMISNFTQSTAGPGSEPRDLLEGTGESFLIGGIVGGIMGGGVEATMGQGNPNLIGDQNVLKVPGSDTPAQTQETAPGAQEAPETTETPSPAPEAPQAQPEEAQATPETPAPAAPAADQPADAGSTVRSAVPAEQLASILPEGITLETIVRSGQANAAGANMTTLGDLDTRFIDQAIRDTEQDIAEAQQRNDTAQEALTTSKLDAMLKISDLLEEPAATEAARAEVTRELTLKPEDLDQQIQVSAERILARQFQGNEGFRKNATEQARKDVRENVELADKRVQRPEQLVTKTGVRDLVKAQGGEIVFNVIEENGRKVLTFENDGTKIRLFPKALGLVEENMQAGDTLRVSSEDLKGKGSALRAHGSSGGALAFNIKNFSEGVLGSKKGEEEVDKIISRSAIARELAQKLGVPVRSGHFKQQALGIFKPWAHVVRLKSKLGDLRIPVLVHEAAHYLDYTMLGQPMKGKALDNPQNWRSTKFVSSMIPLAELDPLLVEYGGTPNSKKREAFAEFVRYWVTEPAKAKERAPRFHEIWEEKILPDFPEVRDTLETTRADWQRWNKMPAVAKVVSQISFGERSKSFAEIKDEIVETWHDQLARWVDDLHPIKRFSDLAKDRGVKFTIEEDPYILARLTRGWVGKANVFLEKGTFDVRFWKEENGKAVPAFTGAGFSEIMAPIAKANATEDFAAYLVARRAINLNERGIHSGVADETAKEAFADLAKNHPEFLDVATQIDEYQDALLDYVYNSGLVTKEAHTKMRTAMRDYVPFFRVMEEAESKGLAGKTLADLRNPIKRIKGSDRDIINPLESIVKNTYSLINAAERNRVGISMVNLSTKHPELGQLFEKVPEEKTKVASVKINELIEQVAGGKMGLMLHESMGDAKPLTAQADLGYMGEQIVNIFRPSFFHDENILTVMIGGKPQSFYVDPQIYKAMHGSEVEDVGVIWKLLSYPARWLRAGATLTPEFMVRNPARDMFSAFVYSEYGFMPPVDVARGLYGALSKDDSYWLWRMGGGEQSMLTSMDRTTLAKTYEEASKGTDLKKFVNPIEDLRLFSEFSEKMTRVGEARKAISRGANPLEAAFAAREVTLDFGKIGSKARSINMIVAFFNAQIQGSVRMVRAFKEHPYRTTTKTLVGITLPSVLLSLWNAQEPDWPEIPQWQKNLFWMIKIGDTWYRFPKPFELGIIFGSIPERVVESIIYDDPNVWPELRKSILDGASPSVLPTSILPIIENTTNYSFFLDRNIVPDSLEGLPAFAQYTTYTSETAKSIGKWLSYSPAKVDNLINGYFAGLGRYAVSLIDKATALAKGEEAAAEPPAATLSDLPIIKAFVVRDPVSSSSESLNRFYIKAETARAAKNYYNDLLQGGKKDEAKEWYADHIGEIALSTYYENTRQNLATLRLLQNQARDSKTLTPEQKRERIDEIGRMMTDLAHKAITITLKENENE